MIVQPEFHAKLRAAEPEAFTDLMFDFMDTNGGSNYDQSVTQLEHALQCAALAAQEDQSDAMIISALLHDLGHLLCGEDADDDSFLADDLCHETVAAEFLAEFFSADVTEPIRYHVPAKRYLCTVDAGYHATLSESSKRSLELQGGPMNEDERRELETNPHLDAIVLLRRWDDRAKVAQLPVPPLEAYRTQMLGELESFMPRAVRKP